MNSDSLVLWLCTIVVVSFLFVDGFNEHYGAGSHALLLVGGINSLMGAMMGPADISVGRTMLIMGTGMLVFGNLIELATEHYASR